MNGCLMSNQLHHESHLMSCRIEMLVRPFLQKWPSVNPALANPSMCRDQGHLDGEFGDQKLEPFSKPVTLAV